MRSLHVKLMALAVVALVRQGHAAEAETDASIELDEVIVRGTLRDMRRDIDKAEDRFFALYNELNENDDLDIRCIRDRRTGSRIPSRLCKPVFYARAEENWMQHLLSTWGVAGALKKDPRKPMQVMHERYDELVDNLGQLLAEHPRLMQLLQERNQLEAQYEAARKRR